MKTFGCLELEKSGNWILTGIAPHVAIRMKAMFAWIEKTQTKQFRFRNTDERCAELVWFMQRYPMEMEPEQRAMLEAGDRAYSAAREAAERILVVDYRPDLNVGFRDGLAPYDYQAQNAALARMMKSLLIADDVGFGKTVSALAALAGSDFLPAAIVVKPNLATQWQTEFIRRFTRLSSHIIQGTQHYTLPPAALYIFKYTNIAGWVDVAAEGAFKAVVYDEVQELRAGTETAKGRAARVFSDAAQLRIGLSATPVYNYGNEIWNVMEFVAPGALGSWDDFVREWCSTGREVKDPDALGTYLREQHLMVRRVRAGRPVNTLVIEVPYDEEVEAEQEALMKRLAMSVLSGTFAERGSAARELDIRMRQITGIAKARHVAAYVRMLLEQDIPVLLAGWHRECYEIWNKHLSDFSPVMYTGSEDTRAKDRAKEAFISGKTNLMMISLRSGEGLDGLQQRCSTTVFGELDWSPKVHEQLIGRTDRPGQKAEEVTAIYLHTNGGSDPLVMDILGVKASQSRGIMDPLSGPQAVHSDESRIKLLAERYLARKAA